MDDEKKVELARELFEGILNNLNTKTTVVRDQVFIETILGNVVVTLPEE